MSSKKQVITKLQGGLGNQLFQYCAGMSVASDCGGEALFVPSSRISNELDAFLDLEVRIAGPSDLRAFGYGKVDDVASRISRKIRRGLLVRMRLLQIIQQSADNAFLKRSPEALSNRVRYVYLDGYFQHPNWFDKNLFEVTRLVNRSLNSVPEVEDLENGTVISLRRGDYVRLGWDLPMSYYENALRLLDPSKGPIWIVGDDALVKELISEKWRSQGFNIRAMPELGVPDIQRDLAFLMRANQVIMSNSTFCWWGVMVGDIHGNHPSRRVIAPARWLPLPGAESLLRSTWEIVNVT